MKFIDKYPPGPRTFTVAPEKEVQPGIFWVDRWFQCQCGIRTPFRMLEMEDSPGVPVCSEECAHQMIADLLTFLGDQTLEEIKALESPSNSPVDRSPDTGEAVGSTPTLGTNVLDQIIDVSKVPDVNPDDVTFSPEDIKALTTPD